MTTLAWLTGECGRLVAVVNYCVDPNAYFGRNTLGYYTSAERQFKILGFTTAYRRQFLLGNSKAALADTSQIQRPYPIFNAGVGGSAAEDVLAMLHHVPPTVPLVVVALDYAQYGNENAYGSQSTPPFFHD